MDGALRILIADNHEPMRKLLRALLKSRRDFEVYESKGGNKAVERVRELKPDLAILDVSATTMAADLDVARDIQKVAPGCALLVMSIDRISELMYEARKIGARGYIIKAEAGDTLLSAVDAIRENKSFF